MRYYSRKGKKINSIFLYICSNQIKVIKMTPTNILIGFIILVILGITNILLIIFKKPKDNREDFLKIDADLSRLDFLMREEFGRNREENQKSFKDNREELNASFKDNRFELANTLKLFEEKLTLNLKEIRETVENRMKTLQDDNNRKLEDMRKVVDEKLQETVEKRFNESFRMISERLEQVHKGLGEMQSLASGVGDLKKVLTNVKTRGSLGEIQLGSILEQILSPEQYEQNVAVKIGSAERVEYVVKLPDKNTENQMVLLPIDSKFPTEDYQRLLDAYENSKEVDIISKQFENSVKKNAKDIRDKYINPPVTTDFAIMFVPTEGLYAEILRRTGLFETLQRDYKITVVGPTNLVAFLSSLQMGFRTLAIEKQTSKVWETLGAVKTEFGHFGVILDRTKKKLEEATNVIDKAGIRSRAIERKLRTVQELPQQQTIELLGETIEIVEDEELEAKDTSFNLK